MAGCQEAVLYSSGKAETKKEEESNLVVGSEELCLDEWDKRNSVANRPIKEVRK
jgi:hypothetical protein